MLQKVVRSTVIDAPIGRVWAVLRDFNSHERWHDVVAASRIEGDGAPTQVGCIRSFTLKDGNRIREQLLSLSDSDYRSTYCIVEATVPLQRYVATVTLKPVTDGDRTFWHWESTFATPPGMERELREMVARGVYEAGFENLRRHLGRATDQRVRSAARLRLRIAASTTVTERMRSTVVRARRLAGELGALAARCLSTRRRPVSISSPQLFHSGAGGRFFAARAASRALAAARLQRFARRSGALVRADRGRRAGGSRVGTIAGCAGQSLCHCAGRASVVHRGASVPHR
jgi:Arc/MetJ-type ribon-helix-helix transcriptional regulator